MIVRIYRVPPGQLLNAGGIAAPCKKGELQAWVGVWTDHRGDTIVIDADLVLDGSEELCIDALGNLVRTALATGDRRTSTFHASPNLVAWETFERRSECGDGVVGRWVNHTNIDDGGWNVHSRELILREDGTVRSAFRETIDDSSIRIEQSGSWESVRDDDDAALTLSGEVPNWTMLVDGDALFVDANHLRR